MRVEIQRLNPFLAKDHFTLFALGRVQRDDIASVGEEQIPRTGRLADTRNAVHRFETVVTSALVRS